MYSKDDEMEANENDIAEQRLDHLAEQAAIRVVVDRTPRDIALRQVRDARHEQDMASYGEVEEDEDGHVVGYFNIDAPDRAMPSNPVQRAKIARLTQELHDELERS